MLETLFADQVASAELAKEAQAADLIPAGKYPFHITAVTQPDQRESYDDGNKNPLYGQPVGRIEVTLKGVGRKGFDELDGRDRKYFFTVSPARIMTKDKKGNDRLHNASRAAGDLIAASETQGKSFSDTLNWFAEHLGQISIGVITNGAGNQMNVVNKITKLV